MTYTSVFMLTEMEGRKAGIQMAEELREPVPIKISVRNLVEFVLRGGDLDNRRTASMEKDAMQAGSRIHRKIQKQMKESYRAEVFMRHTVFEDEFQMVIEGRADGVIEEPGDYVIDEIKGVYFSLSYLEEPIFIHLAQAMCYGYFYCFDKELTQIGIQMTYCNIETEEIRRFRLDKTYEELEEWFKGLIHEYIKWARFQHRHNIRRNESIKQLEFPYPYREGQRDLAVSVYRSIARKKSLFIQAPTGIGKTLSTIFPGLKAMGEGFGDKLFYLTAKTITRGVAEEAFAILRGHGVYLKTVTITAKDKLCILEKPECNPDACPYAKGHYDRINDAVYEIITQETGIGREVILDYARRFDVCPFEFCLDISNWMDGIICDYNYVFDPNVKLKRYFAEGNKGEYLFFVDEAHNLVSRAREMYSAVLVKEDVLEVKHVLKHRSPKLTGILERLNSALLEMKRECQSYLIWEQANHVVSIAMSLFGELEAFMDTNSEFEDRDIVLDFYFVLRDFLNVYDRLDEHYQIYTELLGDKKFMLKFFCVDPSRNIKECLEQGNSTVFFSATLLPIIYYKKLLSGNPEDYAVYAESPFPKENRLLMVASDVSSKYTRRNRNEFEKITGYIRKIAAAKTGNYMVFLPSYQYMNEIAACMDSMGIGGELTFMTQSSRMDESEREKFLKEFEYPREKSMVALCVMGGLFSEGIDLKKELLIGAIVVGTGLPMVCTEQEILKQYFDEHESRGFDFAYQFPGMNKVMQAAGRVIRTLNDVGVIALLDERFLNRDYQQLFPKEWADYVVVNQRTVEGNLKEFWEHHC